MTRADAFMSAVLGLLMFFPPLVAANLYLVLIPVSAATLTSASTSDITVQLGVSDD
jgi:hypothetical protein